MKIWVKANFRVVSSWYIFVWTFTKDAAGDEGKSSRIIDLIPENFYFLSWIIGGIVNRFILTKLHLFIYCGVVCTASLIIPMCRSWLIPWWELIPFTSGGGNERLLLALVCVGCIFLFVEDWLVLLVSLPVVCLLSKLRILLMIKNARVCGYYGLYRLGALLLMAHSVAVDLEDLPTLLRCAHLRRIHVSLVLFNVLVHFFHLVAEVAFYDTIQHWMRLPLCINLQYLRSPFQFIILLDDLFGGLAFVGFFDKAGVLDWLHLHRYWETRHTSQTHRILRELSGSLSMKGMFKGMRPVTEVLIETAWRRFRISPISFKPLISGLRLMG